jgi:hypothetical protein
MAARMRERVAGLMSRALLPILAERRGCAATSIDLLVAEARRLIV